MLGHYTTGPGRKLVKNREKTRFAGVPGLEPRLTESESVGLPITPYPKGADKVYRRE